MLTYFKQIDGLRFFAVFAVMIQHWLANPVRLKVPLGYFGVTVFYVISGFLISRILFHYKDSNKKQGTNNLYSIRQFYIRRFFRIFPIYYLTVFILFLIGIDEVKETIVWLLTYTINIFFFIQGNFDDSTAHFWSLAVEEQFYLIYPWLLFLVNKKYLKHLLWGMVFLAIGCRTILFLSNFSIRSIGFLIFSCFDSFGIGGLLGYYYLYHKEKLQVFFEKKMLLITLLFLCIVSVYLYLKLGDEISMRIIWFRTVISLISVWILGKAIFGFKGWVKWILENEWMIYLGKISYGLYIYHYFMPNIFEYFGIVHPNIFIMFVPYFIASVILSTLSWRFLEQPINRLKKNFQYQKAIVSHNAHNV